MEVIPWNNTEMRKDEEFMIHWKSYQVPTPTN